MCYVFYKVNSEYWTGLKITTETILLYTHSVYFKLGFTIDPPNGQFKSLCLCCI